MCCGKSRAEWRQLGAGKRAESKPVEDSPPSRVRAVALPAQADSVLVRYTEHRHVMVRGPLTARHYEFSGANPVRSVDARDATALLQARYFRRA